MHLMKGVAMSDEYTKEQQDADLRALDQAVSEMADVLRLAQEVKSNVDLEIKAVIAAGVERMAPIDTERKRLAAIVVPLYLRLIEAGVVKGKLIKLPSGTVSTRDSTTTEVLDDKQLLKLAKRLGKLTKLSDRPDRKVNKTKLAELMESEPKLAAQLQAAGLAFRVPNTRLTIKPVDSKLKFEQDILPGERVVIPLAPASS